MKNDKVIKETTLFFGIAGLAIDALDQWIGIQNSPKKEFNYKQSLRRGFKWAAFGFGASATLVTIDQFFNSTNLDGEDFDEKLYLKKVLKSYELDQVDRLTLKKGFEIKNKIFSAFEDKLVKKSHFHGSVPQGAALGGISDLDIFNPFKSSSYRTLEDMHFDMLDFFENDFHDDSLIEVRSQKRSIGLIFEILGEQICIDIVNGKRTNTNRHRKEYYLYENATGLFGKPSRVKIDPIKQANFGKNAKSKSRVVRLVKLLRENQNLPIKSIYIKELTRQAFDKYEKQIPRKIDSQLLIALEYIRDNIEYRRVFSPDNSNNILSNSLSRSEKRKIADNLDYIICDVNENRINLKKYFPHKDEFLI